MSSQEIITERGDMIIPPRQQSGGLTIQDLDRPIDVAAKVAQRKAFHEFFEQVLKPGKHYGIPKDTNIKKPFLWQPGAEEIFSASHCRPEYYEVLNIIDIDKGRAILWRGCRAIHIGTGLVMSSGEGTADTEDFKKGQGANKPFSVLFQNAMMMGNKRAFVACARTLGCASEIFTQDEDMVVSTERTEQAPAATQGADNGVGSVWTDAKDGKLRIHCPEHGRYYAKEWDKGASVKCGKKTGDNEYCSFMVPMPTNKTDQPNEDTGDEFDALKGKDLIAAFTDDAEEAGYHFGGSKAKMAAWSSLLLDEKVETVSQGHMRRVLRQPKGGKLAAAGHLNRQSDKPESDAVREARGDGQEQPLDERDPYLDGDD